MKDNIQALLDFVKSNPLATKATIAEGINIKGLPLFNLLKKLVKDGVIIEDTEAEEMTYIISEAETDATGTEADKELNTNLGESPAVESTPASEATSDGATGNAQSVQFTPASTEDGQEVQTAPAAPAEAKTDNKSLTRDSSKYKFNGQELGKGPLVRAVVAQYVADHKDVTLPALKEVFKDTFVKRLGVIQELSAAKAIAKGGRRYFFNEDQLITLADGTKVCVTNQWTLALFTPFLGLAKELGYVIE